MAPKVSKTVVKKTKAPTKAKLLPKAGSKYPDLTGAIALLAVRQMDELSDEHRQVLQKWQDQLQQLNTEIKRLSKLEEFSANLSRKPLE
ncbi:MAG: hypothetical protein WAX89_08160 [Alphaproteobacteria bacterium]